MSTVSSRNNNNARDQKDDHTLRNRRDPKDDKHLFEISHGTPTSRVQAGQRLRLRQAVHREER